MGLAAIYWVWRPSIRSSSSMHIFVDYSHIVLGAATPGMHVTQGGGCIYASVSQGAEGVLVPAVFLTLPTSRSSGVPNNLPRPESNKLLFLHPNTPAITSANAQINSSSSSVCGQLGSVHWGCNYSNYADFFFPSLNSPWYEERALTKLSSYHGPHGMRSPCID
jgi:hypothetical protein